MGEKDGAMKDYDRAIELEPDCADAYNNRADLKTKIGDFEGAMADIRRAIALDSSKPIYYITLTELYEAMVKEEDDAAKKNEYLSKAAEAKAKAEELKKKDEK